MIRSPYSSYPRRRTNKRSPVSSRHAIAVAAAPLAPEQPGQGVAGSVGVGMAVEPDAAGSADATPMACKQCATEEIPPNFHAVVTPLVLLRADAGERHFLWEQRELRRFEKIGSCGFRHLSATIASKLVGKAYPEAASSLRII